MNVISILNALLADELTAIHQYIVHAEMVANWGYPALNVAVMKRAKTEMKHASMLLSRILFLAGVPVVNRLNAIHVGQDVPMQFQMDRQAEIGAVQNYTAALQMIASDEVTCTLLRSIVNDENGHLAWLETQLALIAQLGVSAYLSPWTRA